LLTSVLVGGEWSASRPGRFTPGEGARGTYWIGGWVGLRTGLDDVEKIRIPPLPGLELQPLGRPVCSQLLYRLSYPGSPCTGVASYWHSHVAVCSRCGPARRYVAVQPRPGLTYTVKGRMFNIMLHVRYVHLTKAKHIHKETNPSSRQRGCYTRNMTVRVQLQKKKTSL
jgi:hypothetical protein